MIDEDQSIGRAYNTICTLRFFGFNINGEWHYRGRIDDALMGNSSNRTQEPLKAMKHIAKTGPTLNIKLRTWATQFNRVKTMADIDLYT